MIAGKEKLIPNESLWQRDGADRYRRVGGCEVVCDSSMLGWRAMVPVQPIKLTPVWQSLMVADRVRHFQSATAAIEAVEAYLSVPSLSGS